MAAAAACIKLGRPAKLRSDDDQRFIEELVLLQSCIQFSHLTDRADHCYLDLSQRSPFSSRGAYHSLHAEDEQNPDAARIWATKLPNKVKFFGWLLLLGRLNSRANLCHKNIRARDEANCEFCPGVLEADEPIFSSAVEPVLFGLDWELIYFRVNTKLLG